MRLNPEGILEHHDLRRNLRECLDLLPESFKQVFVIRDIENETTENICRELNISVSNFSVMMYHVLLILKDCFLKRLLLTFSK